MKDKWIHRIKKGTIILLTVLVFFSLPNLGHAITKVEQQFNLIKEIYELIASYHISNVDSDTLIEGAIHGMIDTLDDPYTTYFTDEEYESFTSSINGSYKGIGIYIEEKDGYIMVQSPISGSPAEKAGLQSGDIIIEVEGINIKEITTEEATGLIKGEEGTTVNLTILRGEETFKVDVERAQIQLPLTTTNMLTQDIGYIKLYTFSNQAVEPFKQGLSQLQKEGMDKLILDLRGNPGGYLGAALDIAKNFIDEGPIVYVKYKTQQEEVLSIEGGTSWNTPLIVLIDRGSASASEILTGALKDYNKATIIGTNSYGKGTVQQLVPLENGGFLKLTISEYFTPNKNKMNGIGVKPDIEVIEPIEQLQTAIYTLSNQVYLPRQGEDWIQVNNRNYIGLTDIVHAFNGNIYWNAKLRSIEISLFNDQVSLYNGLSDGLMIVNGKSFIAADQIQTYFPKLEIKQVEGIITIFTR